MEETWFESRLGLTNPYIRYSFGAGSISRLEDTDEDQLHPALPFKTKMNNTNTVQNDTSHDDFEDDLSPSQEAWIEEMDPGWVFMV